MANYQHTHNLNPSHPGENNTDAQPMATPQPAQHIRRAMDNTSTHPILAEIPAASEAGAATGTGIFPPCITHARINLDPTHTCATCKETVPNNSALERHASQKRHKAFLCTCTTSFVRLCTLNRHIADQAGPQHYCDYCDDNKGFARGDKLIDHLRARHKFEEKAIAQFRSQMHDKAGANGLASSAVTRTDTTLPFSNPTGYYAVLDETPAGQAGSSAGPSAGPAGIFDDAVANFNAVGLQPFNTGGCHPMPGAVENFPEFNFADVDLSGINFAHLDFADVDGDLDMSGMNNFL